MTGEPWQRIWALFEQAVELPEARRSAWLERACDGDAEVRRAVEELLAADREAEAASAPAAVRATVTAPPPPIRASGSEPTVIGPYRVLRRIGQGGMGTVYLAVRADDFLRRLVIKVIRRGMETETVLSRLRTERQILAGLDHPNIARLYDGGSTDDGLPYLALELVEGVPIDAFCAHQGLSIDARLVQFQKVCAAVHYAHQNLVVHRDIKPSNILVTDAGEPKLLDFGIAKLLDPDLASADGPATATWQRPMTPSYASPEQIRGQPVTTATDIYSLGVLLYELLTGRLPFRFAGRSLGEIERMLTTERPLPPSVALTEPAARDGPPAAEDARDRRRQWRARLRRRLSGDLDSIVLKALRAAPGERYGSVEQLSADIERYRTGLAVLARRGTWRYRFGKMVRRRRGPIAAAAALLVLLLAFLAALARQSARIALERDQARRERTEKQHVVDLFSDLFERADPEADGVTVTVSDALERGVSMLRHRLRDQPAERAQLLHTAGVVLGKLGIDGRARSMLDEALAIRTELYGERHGEVAETLGALAAVLRESGAFEPAEAHARRAIAIVRDRSGSSARERVVPLAELVSILCDREEMDAAEPLAREALAIARGLAEDDRTHLVTVLELRARIHSNRGEYRQAAALNREALAERRRLYGDDHVGMQTTLHNLGLALRRLGELEAADEAYAEALALIEKTYGVEHVEYVSTLSNRAGVRYAQGDHAVALDMYRLAQDLLERTYGAHPRVLFIEVRIQRTRIRLGSAREAEADLRAALARWRPRLGEHWFLAEAEGVLGESLSAQGRCAEAEPLLVASFERLLRESRERTKSDAFERLRAHLDRCGGPERLATYRAQLDAGAP